MQVKLNDNHYEVDEGTSLSAFIEQLGLSPKGMAVAIDLKVVPKSEWETTLLTDGLELMLIQAVSGG